MLLQKEKITCKKAMKREGRRRKRRMGKKNFKQEVVKVNVEIQREGEGVGNRERVSEGGYLTE